jgi:hypothetical protein
VKRNVEQLDELIFDCIGSATIAAAPVSSVKARRECHRLPDGEETRGGSSLERTTPAVRRLSSPLLLRFSSLVPSRAVEGHWCLELGQGGGTRAAV